MRPSLRAMSRSLAADEVALLEAPGADVKLLALTVDNDGDALNVGLKRASNRAVGVADGTTGNGVLAADITNLRHDLDLQSAALARSLINKPCKYTTWMTSRK